MSKVTWDKDKCTFILFCYCYSMAVPTLSELGGKVPLCQDFCFPDPRSRGQRSKIKFCEKITIFSIFIIISKENIPLTWNFTHIINVSITNKIYGCHGNQGLRSRDRRQNLHLLILKTATKRLDRFFSNLVGMYTRVGKYVSPGPEVEVKGQR